MISTEDERLNELKKLYFSGEPCDRKYIGSELREAFVLAFDVLWNAEYFVVSDCVYDREGIRAAMINDMSVSDLNDVFEKCTANGKIPDKRIIA